MSSKIEMLAGHEIELRFTVADLLAFIEKVPNGYVVSAAQHPRSLLRSFYGESKLGCELMITIGSEQAGMNSRVGNLRDWLAGEKPDDRVWITCSEGGQDRWSELVVGAGIDHGYTRLLLQT